MPISFAQAAIGADIEVPTLDGPEALAVPRGTQSGDVLRIKGLKTDQIAATLGHCPYEEVVHRDNLVVII